jgi:hypothetical protein
MAEIVYKSLTSLSPIELKYQFSRDENLETRLVSYTDGYSFYKVDGFNNYQDVAINKSSCLILTSAVNLSSVFTTEEQKHIGDLPGSILLQPRDSTVYYAQYQTETNTFRLSLNDYSTFLISPISNNNDVELYIDNKWVQVDENYPFTVRLDIRSLSPDKIHRQRFQVVYQNGLISFLTLTNAGYRYLAFNDDNILRAVGVVFNDSVVNDYIFKCLPVSQNLTTPGFIPSNDWVTYFYEIENEVNNQTVNINKDINTTPTNLLVDFPVEKAVETGVANINIANLKTMVTPAGGPAPTDNTYTKTFISSN